MPAKDLRVQIAGDEAQLNRALDRAEGRMTKYTASVDAQAGAQAKAYERAGQSSAYAGREATAYAAKQEAADRRVKASVGDMVSSHSAAMQKVGDHTAMAGRKISAAGTSILGMVGPLDLAGAAAGKMAVDFSKTMELLHTQANYSQKEVDKLSESVLKLAPSLGVSPKEIAEGLYHVASAGFDASKSMEIVKEAMIGAKLGIASADETTYALVSVLKAAPKDIHSAAEAMAVMNEIVGQGDLRMQQLVDAMSTGIIPRAKAAGLGFRDVGAALDVLTQRGIPAQMAATRLSQTFAFMEKQSKTAEKALESIGMTQGELGADLEKPKGLLVAVEDLQSHLEKLPKTAERNKVILEAFGGGRSSGAIQTLTENVSSLRKQYDKLPEATTAVKHLDSAWADLQKTPAQQLAKDQQEVNVALIELGKQILPTALPIVKDLSQTVGSLAHDFESLSPGTQKAIVDFALAATAVGLLAKPIGGLVSTVGFLEKGFGMAGLAAGKFTRLMGGSLEETVPIAETAGTQAGAAYGAAFAAASRAGMAEVSATSKAGGMVYDIPGFGKSKVPGFGGRTGVPGLGPAGFTAAEQEAAMLGSPQAPLNSLSLKGIGGRLMGAGTVGLTGVLAAQLAGAVIPGHAGSVIAGIGTDTALGAAIGTAIAPGIGTAIGGGLGLLAGAINHLGDNQSHAERQAGNATRGLPKLGDKATSDLESEIKRLWDRADRQINGLASSTHPTSGVRGAGAQGSQDTTTPENRRKIEAIKQQAELKEGGLIGKQESSYISSGAVLTSFGSVIDTVKKKMRELGPAAKDGMYSAMVGMVKELESKGRLPVGSTKQFIDAMHRQFSTLGTYSKEAAATTVREWELMRTGGAALKSANDFVLHILGAQKTIPITTKTTAAEAAHFFAAGEDELLSIVKHSTGERHKIALQAYNDLRGMDARYWEGQRAAAAVNLTEINASIKSLAHKGSKAYLTEWQSIEKPLKTLWEEGYLTTAEYTQKMAEVVGGELASLGVKPNAIGRKAAKFGPGPGSPNPLVGGLPGGVGEGRAHGSWIGRPGERGRDTVPIWAGAGEAILNHDQQGPVQVGLAVSKMIGAQPYGSLNELFANERKPHYMAGGGVVAPHVNVPGQVGQMAQAGLNLEARTANALLRRLAHAAGGSMPGGHVGGAGKGAYSAVQPVGRVDQGLDFTGAGPFGAIADGVVIRDTLWPGWPGTGGLVYKTAVGNVYAMEHVQPAVKVGDHVSPGQTIGHVLPGYPWLETGWANQAGTGPLTPYNGAADGTAMPGGKSFKSYLGYARGGFAEAAGHAGGGFVATAYGPPWEGIEGTGVTATGVNLKGTTSKSGKTSYPHKYIIAVDPSVIPLGSQVKVWPNPFGYTGNFLAADTGGAIKGNRIDFYDWEGRAAQNAWGKRNVTVSVSGTVTGGKKKAPPSGLHLTGHQEATVQGYLGGAGSDRAARTQYGVEAGEVAGALETHQARWAAQPADLKTAAGAHIAEARAEQAVISDKDVLRYYGDELKALNREAKKWAKLRDFYRKLAKHKHGTAKKQALDAAGKYQGKIAQAQRDAKVLKGTIYSQETKVIEAETGQESVAGEAAAAQAEVASAAAQAAAEIPGNDLAAYQAANSHVDLEVRAGVLTADQGKAAKEANARKALGGGFGALSDEGVLQVKGDLKELSEATQEATSAIEAHTQALKDATKALSDFTNASNQIAEVESGSLLKSIADLVSGQIAGVGLQGRRANPGSGAAARY